MYREPTGAARTSLECAAQRLRPRTHAADAASHRHAVAAAPGINNIYDHGI